MSTVGTLALIEESFLNLILSICKKNIFILISRLCFKFTKSNLNGYLLSSSSLSLDGKSEADSVEAHSHATT
jgi:hypothetical protein